MKIKPAIGQALGQNFSKLGAERCGSSRHNGISESMSDFAVWREVDADGLASLPIGRYLQDRRPAEPAMSEKHLLAKRLLSAGGHHFRGNSGQVTILCGVVGTP